ncbi:MAG: hypothetical protein PHV06_07425, partial [bacterium]|nr:hypothetical protein [bacterium]
MRAKGFLVILIFLIVLFESCVRFEEPFLPSDEKITGSDKFPAIKFTGSTPLDGSKIKRNYVKVQWEMYDDKYYPGDCSYKLFLNSEQISGDISEFEKLITHLNRGEQTVKVICKTPDNRKASAEVDFTVETNYENDWVPPEIQGYDFYHPHHSEYFFISSDGIEWKNSRYLEFEIYPDYFSVLLNWDFCFRDKNDQTPIDELEYQIKLLTGVLESEWISLAFATQFIFDIKEYEKIFLCNFDEGKLISIQVRCLDGCGNISDYIEKKIKISLYPPQLDFYFFGWDSEVGKEYFKKIWIEGIAEDKIPGYSVFIKNNSNYSGYVTVKNEFTKYTLSVLDHGNIQTIADIEKPLKIYDMLKKENIEDGFFIYGKQGKEIRMVCDRNFQNILDYEIYDPNVDINELKKLILCYELDGITTKNKFRINGNWGMTGIFYDQEGYYYKYPTFECEFRKPIIETECKELFIEEKNLTFTV